MTEFQPLPWHQPLLERFRSQRAADRLAHAYLLRGPEGVGKYQLARVLAAGVLCQNADDSACGRCRSCTLLAAGTHPDLLQVIPETAGKQIRIDQIRQLIAFAAKTAQMGGHRVILLGPAEAMNVNAANALLKVLEEPGADTLLLLFSHQLGDVLPTLRSRCQVLYQPLPEADEACRWLAGEQPDIDPEQLALAYELAGQRPLLARDYLAGDALDWRSRILADLGQVTKGQVAPVAVAGRWSDVDLLVLLDWLSRWLTDMVRYRETRDETMLGAADSRAMLRYIAQKAGSCRLLDFYQQLLEWRRIQRTQGSLNKTLLIETILIRWLQLTLPTTS